MQRQLDDAIVAKIEFQSMHPIKDATRETVPNYKEFKISIHAPYKGCNESKQYI